MGRLVQLLVILVCLSLHGGEAMAQLNSLANPSRSTFSFRFPLSWEVLRSGFNTLDVALEAETYAEYWSLDSNGTEIFLSSPRARIRVLGMHTQGAYGAPFDTLLLTESDFAKLLGIQHKVLDEKDRWLFVTLPIFDASSQRFVLTASPEYFISVDLLINFSGA